MRAGIYVLLLASLMIVCFMFGGWLAGIVTPSYQ